MGKKLSKSEENNLINSTIHNKDNVETVGKDLISRGYDEKYVTDLMNKIEIKMQDMSRKGKLPENASICDKLIDVCEDLNEAQDYSGTQIEMMSKQIEMTFKKAMPDAYVNVGPRKIVGEPFIDVRVAQSTKWAHNIIENDPMYTLLMVNGFDHDGNLASDKLEIELLAGKRVGPRMKRTDLKWRKISAKPAVALKALERYIIKMKEFADKNPVSK